ncbi:MAG: hypothetical protein IKO68_08220 [Oscillospiraceae bacterium]|nr:hypothetical protein [Oscillospiraceae bacterium]
MNITLVRGDTLAFGVLIENNTQPLDAAFFSAKKDKDDEAYILQASIGDGIELAETGENSTTYRVRVSPEKTERVTPGNYYYDLQIQQNGDVFTVLMGTLVVLNDITRGGGAS